MIGHQTGHEKWKFSHVHCPGFVWTPIAESIEVHHSIVREEMKGLSPREVYGRLVDQMVLLKRDQSPEVSLRISLDK